MSDTPRTDAAEHEDSQWCAHLADFARSLERELAAMTAAKDKAVEALKDALSEIDRGRDWPHPLDKVIAELEAVH